MLRRLTIITGALLITTITGTLTARMTHQQPSAQSEDWRERDRQHVAEVNARLNDPTKDREFAAKIQQMRAKWKTWAMQQQPDLQSMLRNDPAAFNRVYQALPTFLPDDGSAGLRHADLEDHGLLFDWMPIVKLSASPQSAALQEKQFATKMLQFDFANYHDIELCHSITTGTSKYTLWASGRVTHQTAYLQKTAGAETLREGAHQDICPPYEELTR